MRTANGAIEKKDTFLQHVSLKNYKSIKDVEIDFKPGLNIIIGKNASGKTNFINGLNTILNFNYEKILDSETDVIASFKNAKIEIQALSSIGVEHLVETSRFKFSFEHRMSLKINDIEIATNDLDDLRERLLNDEYFFNVTLIKYGIHYKENTPFINLPYSFAFSNNGKFSREILTIVGEDQSQFINNLFHRLQVDLASLYYGAQKIELAEIEYKSKVISFLEGRFNHINAVIFKYSPIKAVRLNPDFNVIYEEANQKRIVTNFYLEFLIENQWLTFNLLSDGTKRLFYIISEFLSMDYEDIWKGEGDINIVLLEEPELGIHPHQLHQLMQFIKEQSREKQIIITTHSPQVLDVLGSDELDRLIICSTDPKNGTQLNHLSDNQVNKAKKYMKEDFLSDFWRFSDLEPA